MATDEKEMKELINELILFTKEWKLDINEDKSQVMKVKVKDKEERLWKVEAEL